MWAKLRCKKKKLLCLERKGSNKTSKLKLNTLHFT